MRWVCRFIRQWHQYRRHITSCTNRNPPSGVIVTDLPLLHSRAWPVGLYDFQRWFFVREVSVDILNIRHNQGNDTYQSRMTRLLKLPKVILTIAISTHKHTHIYTYIYIVCTKPYITSYPVSS